MDNKYAKPGQYKYISEKKNWKIFFSVRIAQLSAPQCLWVSLDGIWINFIRGGRLPYLWGILNSFSSSFFDLYSYDCEKVRGIELRLHDGGWHETLNSFHVTSCEMVRFVRFYINQNNKS